MQTKAVIAMLHELRSESRWPMEMRAETAAQYCDEPSVDAFRHKVKRKIYPQPVRGTGMLPKWHRARLDENIALRHGIDPHGSTTSEDLAGLI